MMVNPIGGYFELELPRGRTQVYPGALRFQSGRSAFLALLRAARPNRVWMPRYLCDTMNAPLREAGIGCEQYSVDERFEIIGEPAVREHDWFYYVNYFGVRDSYVDEVLSRFEPQHVIVDNCQAFFSRPRDCAATIYSPRKFFGVPDGGLLVTLCQVEPPAQRDTGSLARSRHLIERLASTPESGYTSYQAAEQSLESLEPHGMSQLTETLLSTIDLNQARLRRNDNFLALHTKLAPFNRCALDVATVDGPLCYPLLIEAPGLREHLIASRIFVATYWPDVARRVEADSVEAGLIKHLLPLPCDQRYSMVEMAQIADACLEFLKRQ